MISAIGAIQLEVSFLVQVEVSETETFQCRKVTYL